MCVELPLWLVLLCGECADALFLSMFRAFFSFSARELMKKCSLFSSSVYMDGGCSCRSCAEGLNLNVLTALMTVSISLRALRMARFSSSLMCLLCVCECVCVCMCA